MKKNLFLTAFLLLGTILFAQEDTIEPVPSFFPPDYEQIKQDCQNKHSERYYPKLVKRFEKCDSTLELQDLQTLYYGQVFKEDYSPYGNPAEFELINIILDKEEPDKSDALSIISLADKVIKRNPAEPKAYYYKYIGHNILCKNFDGDTTELFKPQMQFEMLFYTISYSGNGINADVPMYVTSVPHEYLMMNMYGFRFRSQQLVSKNRHSFDMFVLDSNEYAVDSLWFNIDPIIASWDNVFNDDEKTSNEKVTSLDLKLGTYFVIKLDKTKRKNSKFHVVETRSISDTLVADKEKLFKEEIPEDCIAGYFCPMRLYEASEHISNDLVFISNSKKKMLYFDTEMLIHGSSAFRPTSNSGMLRGCMMNEIWNDPIATLRISNIRTKK